MSDEKLVDLVEVYLDGKAEWRWRAKSANGQIVADSGEGYLLRSDVDAIVAELFPETPVKVKNASD